MKSIEAVPVFEDLIRGTLDDRPKVVAARRASADACEAEARATSTRAAAHVAMTHAPDARRRRSSRTEFEAAIEAGFDAVDAVAVARESLVAARREAFLEVAPIIRDRHVALMTTRLLPALRALDTIVDELIGIERVAGNFRLSGGASIAPARSAIAGEVGEEMKLRISAWLATIERHRPSAAA